MSLALVNESFLTLHIRRLSTHVYQIVEQDVGIEIIWDLKAGLFVTLAESYQTFVNGLAGNYDGSAKREFTSSVGGIETDVCIWSSSFQLDQFCKVRGPILSLVKMDGLFYLRSAFFQI